MFIFNLSDDAILNQSRMLSSEVSADPHRLRLRKVFRLATWNVRTLKGIGKLELLSREIHRTNVDIVVLSKVR